MRRKSMVSGGVAAALLNAAGEIAVYASETTHFVLDVNGYFQ